MIFGLFEGLGIHVLFTRECIESKLGSRRRTQCENY